MRDARPHRCRRTPTAILPL